MYVEMFLAPIALVVERAICNREAGGSNPSGGSIKITNLHHDIHFFITYYWRLDFLAVRRIPRRSNLCC